MIIYNLLGFNKENNQKHRQTKTTYVFENRSKILGWRMRILTYKCIRAEVIVLNITLPLTCPQTQPHKLLRVQTALSRIFFYVNKRSLTIAFLYGIKWSKAVLNVCPVCSSIVIIKLNDHVILRSNVGTASYSFGVYKMYFNIPSKNNILFVLFKIQSRKQTSIWRIVIVLLIMLAWIPFLLIARR